MSIEEAAKQGISVLTRPEWSPHARATIHLFAGGHGPWVTVEDAATDAGAVEPPKVLWYQLPQDGWEAYEPKEDHRNAE